MCSCYVHLCVLECCFNLVRISLCVIVLHCSCVVCFIVHVIMLCFHVRVCAHACVACVHVRVVRHHYVVCIN